MTDAFDKLKEALISSQVSGELPPKRVLIPMIRKIMPSLAANEIWKVQPMDREPIRGDYRLRMNGQVGNLYDGENWIDSKSIEGQRIVREQELT